ncbi:flavodoxin family protein [Desulfurococcaceae archaeon MEX13E-LK6-19]|nr:flavodoxin family protein [Desulfurococcaceae archaeon MEX13E-LK6-19]
MKPKILLINGSPRKYGAVYKLLKIAEKGVIDAGGEPRIIHLYDYNIKPCIGCVSDEHLVCRFPCIIKDDDFNKIGDMVLESDGIIFGTPIYWYSVSGVLKNFIDRLTSMENMIFHTGRSLLEGKVAGFIATGNDSGSIHVLAYMMVTMNSMGVHIPAWAIAYHHTADDVLEDEQAIRDSYNIGYNVTKAAETLKNVGPWYRANIDLNKLAEIARESAEKEKASQYPIREKFYRESLG